MTRRNATRRRHVAANLAGFALFLAVCPINGKCDSLHLVQRLKKAYGDYQAPLRPGEEVCGNPAFLLIQLM